MVSVARHFLIYLFVWLATTTQSRETKIVVSSFYVWKKCSCCMLNDYPGLVRETSLRLWTPLHRIFCTALRWICPTHEHICFNVPQDTMCQNKIPKCWQGVFYSHPKQVYLYIICAAFGGYVMWILRHLILWFPCVPFLVPSLAYPGNQWPFCGLADWWQSRSPRKVPRPGGLPRDHLRR